MEILFGRGIANLLFGMTQKEVEMTLGKPDKTFELRYTDSDCSSFYLYNAIQAQLEFSQESDMKLASIELYDSRVVLFHQRILTKSIDDIKALLNKNGYFNLEFNDYEIFETIGCDEINMEFHFEFNKLVCVEFGPLFDSNDEVIWPNT